MTREEVEWKSQLGTQIISSLLFVGLHGRGLVYALNTHRIIFEDIFEAITS